MLLSVTLGLRMGMPRALASSRTIAEAAIIMWLASPVVSLAQTADFNGDGRVDFDDFFMFADHFGSQPTSTNWDTRYDLNADSVVDGDDFFLFSDQFGQKVILAPTDLLAAALSGARVDLSWTDNSTNETGFDLERCTGADCSNFGQLNSLRANTTSVSDQSTSPGTIYRYRIRAHGGAGYSNHSDYSDAATATTPTAGPTIITTSPLPDAFVGESYRYQLAAHGGVTPYTWSASNGPEPDGLSLSPSGLDLE